MISIPKAVEKIKEGAKIRSDASVMNRAESCKTFSYHMDNKCYKTYTMSTTQESVASKRKQSETVEPGESSLSVLILEVTQKPSYLITRYKIRWLVLSKHMEIHSASTITITLKNFVTQVYAENSVAETEKEFSDYQKNVYVHRTVLLSERISMFNLCR